MTEMQVESLLDEEIPSLPSETSATEPVSPPPVVSAATGTGAAPQEYRVDDVTRQDTVAEILAQSVLRSAGYRILAPFLGGARVYNAGLLNDTFTSRGVAAIIDVETTGDNPQVDEIVQLAIQRVIFDSTTREILAVDAPISWMQEPTRPMQPEAIAVHGITPEMLRGLPRIDSMQVIRVLSDAELLIAHNAGFDAPMFVRQFPMFNTRAWGCSLNDIPWRARGYESARLGALLQDHTQCHFHGHDAGRDVAATAHVLATPFADGTMPLSVLLASAFAPRVRVIANGAPFDAKDLLKARGYQWNDSTKPGARLRNVKAWWTECLAADLPAERDWLARNVYHSVFADSTPIRVVPIDPATRFLS